MTENTAAPPIPLVPPKSSGLHQIDQLVLGYRGAKALFAAASLDLFTALAPGSLDVLRLSRALRTKPRPTQVLLEALASLGFLVKSGALYSNSALASTYLVRGSPYYMGDNLKYQNMAWDSWSHLEGLLRNGEAKIRVRELLSRSPDFTKAYILGMDNIALIPARAIAQRVDLGRCRRILDVGAGPGAYTRAFLQKYPHLKAVLLDLPPALTVARKVLRCSPLRKRIRLQPGDYHQAAFGRQRYDAVLISHVTHNEDEPANNRLIRKAYYALRPNGVLLIHDFAVPDTGTAPAFASLLSLHMMATTGSGKIYSRSEYASWMRSAGFSKMKAWPIPSNLENPTWLLVGTKAEE